MFKVCQGILQGGIGCVCDCGFGVKPHAKTSFLIKKAQGVPKAQKVHTRLRRKAQLKARP